MNAVKNVVKNVFIRIWNSIAIYALINVDVRVYVYEINHFFIFSGFPLACLLCIVSLLRGILVDALPMVLY